MGDEADDIIESGLLSEDFDERDWLENEDTVSASIGIPIVEIVHETDKSWLLRVLIAEKELESWFPKSKCKLEDKEVVVIPQWLLDLKRKEVDKL